MTTSKAHKTYTESHERKGCEEVVGLHDLGKMGPMLARLTIRKRAK